MSDAQIVAGLLTRVERAVVAAEADPYDHSAVDEADAICDRLLGLYGDRLTSTQARHVQQLARRVKKLEGGLGGDLGRLALVDYRPFVPICAKAYLARPDFEPSAVYSWKALSKHIDTMFDRLQSRVEVIFTEKDPYPNFKAMVKDIRENKRMMIFTGSSDHPVFSHEQNWRFRAVHDYIAHAGGEHEFTLRGEMAAYNRHVKLAPPAARLALFVEIPAQTCAFCYTGKFGGQKVCNLYGFDFVNVGEYDEREYQRNFR